MTLELPHPGAVARGPRRGFYWQDWYAAWTMLRCWAEPAEGITAVEVEAADAPHVDDVIIHRRDRIIFKQLKHTVDDAGRFTGANLFSEQDGISLIGKLFKGWSRVRARANSEIEVHVTTNAVASGDTRNQLLSPLEFQRRVLDPVRSGTWTCPDDLQPILDKLQALTRASARATLLDFLAVLRLEFGAPDEHELRRDVIELLRDRLRPGATVETEAGAWAAKVYDISTQNSAVGPLSRDDIDRELRAIFGQARRLVEHRLALPDHHIPRPGLVDVILRSAHELGSGYLMVLGPPGCGKSTLSTWIANEHDDKLLMRYHVFDPRMASGLERKGRASALEFVRTMFDVLAKRFPGRAEPFVPTEETLPSAVAALREELSRLSGSSTNIIVLDGIDHVVRSEVERTSLFDALPQPPPRNVVFVLFGQPDWEYPAWLDRAVRVPVPPFTREETRVHVCGRMGWTLDNPGAAAIADALHNRSEGNPLSLFYNLSVLEALGTSPEDVGAALQKAVLFGGSPHKEYDRLLDDLEGLLPKPQNSTSLRSELLACLAVSEVAITEQRLCAAFADDGLTLRQARDYLRGLRPVVVERRPGQYWLFHDDFRRYAEERTGASERSVAHRRLGHALERDWKGEELSALVEHSWRGNNDQRLADLPGERPLEEWFRVAPRRTVVTMHKLALAAAFRLGGDLGILRNSLAVARAVEAADLPWSGADEVTSDLGLKWWSFVVPPRDIDPKSLRRRADALRAAAYGCEREPSLATEIANRFMLSANAFPDPEASDNHDFRTYIDALARWLLRSGDLLGSRNLAANELTGPLSASAFSSEFLLARDENVVTAWAESLAGVDEWLDRELVEAALLHLVDGREGCALSIARSLARSPSVTIEACRDASVLRSIIRQENVVDAKYLDALVRWNERAWMNPVEWREFFFHGFVIAAAGPIKDLGAYDFPVRFTRAFAERVDGDSHARLAAFLWRCGCAAGLACRGVNLLTPQELERIIFVLIGKDDIEVEPFLRYTFDGFAKIYAPLLVRAVRHRPSLSEKARGILVPEARKVISLPGSRTFGLMEATWLIAPETWRSMAVDVRTVSDLPGTDSTGRAEWFRYWIERGAERGIEGSEEFMARSEIAALGVPRKTDPAQLAVKLLWDDRDCSLDKIKGVRRLIDLLIRLDSEPEGDRAARRQLPWVLALALKHDPSLFWEEFLRSAVEHGVGDAFGSVPANIVRQWLDAADTATAGELVALWYWLASCSSEFDDDGDAAEAGRAIILKLGELDAKDEAKKIESWLGALAKHKEDLDVTPSSSFREGVMTGNTGQWLGSTASGEGESSEVIRNKHSLPAIGEVTPQWFSPWVSSVEHKVLREYLDNGGDVAWHYVCRRIAEQIANSSEFLGYDASLIAEGLIELRPCVPIAEAFDLSIQHLSAKVRFQKEPRSREVVKSGMSRLEALVGLVARGVDIGDAETLLRSLRSLGALAQNSATAPLVEREMLTRLSADESRMLVHALLILRRISDLREESRAKIRPIVDHPDIWCRWLACSILGVEPRWPDLRDLVAPSGPISPEPLPAHSALGAVYYADVTSIREIYIRKLKNLYDSLQVANEEDLRSWLELEFRDLPTLHGRASGWRDSKPGSMLTNNRMAEAAGRLACRLASIFPPPALPALMSAVAKTDPWLALAGPVIDPPEGWVELCRCESSVSNDQEEYLLRSSAIVPKGILDSGGEWSSESLARLGSLLLVPEAPKDFAWVSEEWPLMVPPRMKRGPIMPLSFLNHPFTELGRDRFQLVPRWDLPPFRGLHFEVNDTPQWVDQRMGPVLTGAYREYFVDQRGGDHPIVAWWAGWYASPLWLKKFMQRNTLLVRFWRIEMSERSAMKPKRENSIEYGLEENII